MKKIKKAQAGTYFAFPSGRLTRTRPDPVLKGSVGVESMDTTGYSKGKKSFTFSSDYPGKRKQSKTISREEVPSKISEMKKGASRINEYKKPAKKSAAGSKIKKAQSGEEVIRGSRPGLGVFRTEKKRTTAGGIAKPYEYKRTSVDTTGYSKGRPSYNVKTETGEGDKTGGRVKSRSSKTISRKDVPSVLKSLQQKRKGGNVSKAKFGKMISKKVASSRKKK